jgi:hypothetical protein
MNDTPTAIPSTVKVAALLQEAPGMLSGPDAPPELQAVAGFWPMIAPRIFPLLPTDPGEMDRLVESMALAVLRCRSDDAPGYTLTLDGGEVTAQPLGEDGAGGREPEAEGEGDAASAVDADEPGADYSISRGLTEPEQPQ